MALESGQLTDAQKREVEVYSERIAHGGTVLLNTKKQEAIIEALAGRVVQKVFQHTPRSGLVLLSGSSPIRR